MFTNALLLFLCYLGCSNALRTASVAYNETSKKYTIQDGAAENWLALATFEDEIFTTGWSYLEVTTTSRDQRFTDDQQAYAAGLVEGYLTSDLISNHRKNVVDNYCKGEDQYCQRLKRYLDKNLEFVNQQIKDFFSDPYWHQASLILEQVSGLEDGYRNVTGVPRTQIDVFGMMFFNVFGDLEDLEGILNRTVSKKVTGSGSCSALIKLLPGNADLYVSQDTWNTYSSMLRIQKKYDFEFHLSPTGNAVIPGRVAAFSSYPGLVFSGDDFYILSSGLATLETTIGNSNQNLWKYISPASVLEWMRTVIANRLSKSGFEWIKYFRKFNSGTYNNQWMVVNYNVFSPGQRLEDGLLWVLEQLPGTTESADVTSVLRNQSYWPSYNSPYFPMIFNMSGTEEAVKKYGDWFTYDKTPRALIFKRDQEKVVDIDTMIKLMRYNDYQNDPLSRCNCTPPYSAENAISARSDLNPSNGTYPFGALGYRSHGGTDMKLTNVQLFQKFQFIAISGPTADDVPPFQWSTAGFRDTEPHEGHPDLWNFNPVTHQWRHNNV